MVFAVSKSGIGLTQRGVCTAVTFGLKLLTHSAPVQARASPASSRCGAHQLSSRTKTEHEIL